MIICIGKREDNTFKRKLLKRYSDFTYRFDDKLTLKLHIEACAVINREYPDWLQPYYFLDTETKRWRYGDNSEKYTYDIGIWL